MGKSERSTKDKSTAARMKALGIQRNNATCPVCSKPQTARGLYAHMRNCGGNYRGSH